MKTVLPEAIRSALQGLPQEHRDLAETVGYIFDLSSEHARLVRAMLWAAQNSVSFLFVSEVLKYDQEWERTISGKGSMASMLGLAEYAALRFRKEALDEHMRPAKDHLVRSDEEHASMEARNDLKKQYQAALSTEPKDEVGA